MDRYKKIISKNEKRYAFIDESGNYGFNFEKSGVSSHFIITAIIVLESELKDIENKVEHIRNKYFQKGEIKSSSIGKNHNRRKMILNDLNNVNYRHYTVVVNKKKICSDSGLMYKKPFIKYLNRMLHDELRRCFPKLQLVADEHGSKEFMKSFVEYVNTNSILNLFEEYEFGFDNSKSNVLIQLADLIAGTIAYKYDDNKNNIEYRQFKSLIEYKCLNLVEWPFEYDRYIYEYESKKNNENKFDEIIYCNSIRLAISYIEKYKVKRDLELRERIIVLQYLLTMLMVKKDERYVNSTELINNLKVYTGKEYSRHYFKTKIIAKLRDEGVLISSSNRGYKIPECENDIYSFVNQTSQMINPMVARLKKARNRILIATNNELDILKKDEYQKLRELVNK